MQVCVNGRTHNVYGPDWTTASIETSVLQDAIGILKEFIGMNVSIHYTPIWKETEGDMQTVYLRGDDSTGPSVTFRNGMFWHRSTDWVNDDAYLYDED